MTRVGSAKRPARRCGGDDGALLVELGLVAVVLFLVVFGVIDLGRAYALQNRLANSAREGAASAQFKPRNVDTGCASGSNVVDRASSEDTGLTSLSGFAITVAKSVSGTQTTYTGCGTANVSAGDTVVVTVKADFSPLTPLMGSIMGNTISMSKSVSVVVQG